jgi:hypothetical protein
MLPSSHVRHYIHINLVVVKKQIEHPTLPDLDCAVPPDVGYMHEVSGIREHSLCDNRMNVAVPIDQIAECLDSTNHSGNAAITINLQLENFTDSIVGRPTELA